MAQYIHNTEVLPRDIRQVDNQHSMGEKLQDYYSILNENKKSEVRNALLCRGTPRVLTQRIGHPLNPAIICHGVLSNQGIIRNNHDHRDMVEK